MKPSFLQEVPASPHGVVIFSYQKANFAGLFSFVVYLFNFMNSCNDNNLIAVILTWMAIAFLIMLLISVIFSAAFMTMLIFSMGVNLMADFWLKPIVVSAACGSS